MNSIRKTKITGIFLALLLIVSGCSNNAVPATTNPKTTSSDASTTTDGSKQEQQATISAKDTAPTTVVPGQKLKVSYIDVGQADSILIQIPNGKNVLIDAGNNGDAGIITSYLKGQSVNKLDIVIATHPHEDHIGSMDTIIKTFDIGQVIMPRKDATTQTYKDMITAIQGKGLKVTEAKAGLKLDLGPEVNALLLAPNSTGYEDVNNFSAVLKLSYGTNTFLFNGDAADQSENEIIKGGFNLKADVLKVGHHGSATSSSAAFLSKVQPKYAVISVGKGNTYGHPTQDTIARLANIDAKVYRTDQSGTIVAESDGTNITINAIASEVQPRAPTPTVSQAAPAAVAPVVSPSPTTKQTSQEVTVYITKSGKKYHADGCKSLSKSKISISLTDAKSKGYGPCSLCNPPQ